MNQSDLIAFLLLLGIVAAVLCVLGGITANKTPHKPPPTPDDVQRSRDGADFTSSGLHLTWPLDFTLSTTFEGFEQAATGASVLLTRVPGPLADVTAGFTDTGLASRGMQAVSQEERAHDGLPARLLHVSQQAHGIPFSKWILAFGDERESFLVVATWPEEHATTLSALLRETVLSARRSAAADAPAPPVLEKPFTIAPGGGLLPATGSGQSQAFTRGGILPVETPGSPLFVTAMGRRAVSDSDNNAFARTRIQQIDSVRGVTITAQAPLHVDDLDGVEIVGRGTDAGTAVLVYQAVLFDEETYFLLQGFVALDDQREFSPVFKTMARTFRRTPPTD